jgi:glycosyltransferase involved in cell wall biosynthesis
LTVHAIVMIRSAPHRSSVPLRVLYLQPGPLFGGAERQAATLLPLLSASGAQVTALAGPGEAIVRWLRRSGVERVLHSGDFPGGWPKPHGLERLALPWRYGRCGARLRCTVDALLAAGEVDVVVAALAFSWIVATPVAARHGVPVVWRAGGLGLRPWQRAALAAWARRHPPARLVGPTEEVAACFGPLVPAPCEVIPNGVDLQVFHPEAGDAGRFRPPDAGLVVGFAARLSPEKRTDDFLRIAAGLAAVRREVRFLVAGEGSRRAAYEARARALGLGDRIRFLGYVDEMPSFHAACDVLVLPSEAEGCPNVVLEAMAMGRVPLVSHTATGDVVHDGEDGLVFPLGDVSGAVRALTRLLGRPELRERLAACARARVCQEHDARRAAGRWLEMLSAVASEARWARGRAGKVVARSPRWPRADRPGTDDGRSGALPAHWHLRPDSG